LTLVFEDTKTAEECANAMRRTHLILKRAATSRPSGEWKNDDYDVLADGGVVGRIFKVHAAPVGAPWM
jgi:hypothetical protein